MTRHILAVSLLVTWILSTTSCERTNKQAVVYRYSATIRENLSENQPSLKESGTTAQEGGYCGHFFSQPVSIMVFSTPRDASEVGSFSITRRMTTKHLPIKKWMKDDKAVYAICEPQASNGVVSIETESKILTEPLLRELVGKFIPDLGSDGE
jgi:hypothetical protein